MNHIVLARKWRPKKFANLVGQQATVTILQNSIRSGRIHHAYLLTGTRGVGKTTIARIIAKALNCLQPAEDEPCGSCENCQQIDRGRLIDVIEIDAASNTGVDNIREVLENAQYAPTSAKYKIYIIDEVHMLSKSAFNAMLKTLEEPPAHVIFILATTDPHKVPITILSRCLQLKLRNLAGPEIEQHLELVLNEEGVAFEPAALEALATVAAGSMRDALSLTDQAIAFASGTLTLAVVQRMLGITDDGSIVAILGAIAKANSNQLVEICQRLNSQGSDLENVLQQINYKLFEIGLAQLSSQSKPTAELLELARTISLQDCQLYFEISNLGLEQISKVSNKYPIFVMTLLRMLAFTIGSSQEKQILVSSNNCTTSLLSKQQVVEAISLNSVEEEPAPIFNGNWLEFVQSCDFSQIKDAAVAMVLRNSQLDSYNQQQISLLINDTFRNLVTPACVDSLEQLLFNCYNSHFDLEFNFSSETKASLKSHQLNQSIHQQALAEESINNDPIIQDLISTFSAKIQPNSIKAL